MEQTAENTLNTPHHTPQELEEAYAVMARGGLILVKLDIGYGFVGCSEEAIRRMYELKGRPASNPCVVPGNMAILQQLCPGIDARTLDWIGEQMRWTTLSVIGDLNEDSTLWQSLPPFVRNQSSHERSVAVFLRPGTFLEALVERAFDDGRLLAGSSGNLSGQGNCYRPEDLAESIIEGVDLFINHGVARYENPQRMATTMIDLRTLEIKRRGINCAKLESSLARLRADSGNQRART